mmetsp:Transcript_108629/g.187922  ORF Transcript_108629/g.187922 Transcript_108629/m.187922 type:complete len:104 (-) Transcript_108629:1406-1717(-)
MIKCSSSMGDVKTNGSDGSPWSGYWSLLSTQRGINSTSLAGGSLPGPVGCERLHTEYTETRCTLKTKYREYSCPIQIRSFERQGMGVPPFSNDLGAKRPGRDR